MYLAIQMNRVETLCSEVVHNEVLTLTKYLFEKLKIVDILTIFG